MDLLTCVLAMACLMIVEDSGGVAKDGEYFWNHYSAGCWTGGIDGEKERRVVGTETVTEPEYGYYEVQ